MTAESLGYLLYFDRTEPQELSLSYWGMLCESRKMRNTLQVFSSFEEAEEADREFYASLSSQERLDIVLELIARHREFTGEAAEGFERVYRVVELEWVEYVVVGGHAVGFHGYPRYTGDIDFWIRPSAANAGRVVEVLKKFPDLKSLLRNKRASGRPKDLADVVSRRK